MHLTQGRLLLVSGSLNVSVRLSFLFPAVGGLQPCLRHKCHLGSSLNWDLDLDFSGLTLLRILLAIYSFVISTLDFWHHIMATTTVKFTNLLALDPSVLDTAWCTFLSNPRAWALVIPEDRREEILKTGFDGWSSTTKLNTTRLAKLFRDNFGVTLVSSSFLIYRNAFLFGIALAWGVEANQYDLHAQQSEAAFAVSDVIGGKRINVPGGAKVL